MSILNNAGHDPAQQPPAPRSTMRSALEIFEAIASFQRDPPDTKFQRGFLAALEWVSGQARPTPIPPRQK